MSARAWAADVPNLNDLLPFPARPQTQAWAPERARLLPLLQAEAARQGVPPALADAVAMVETGYTENAVGTSGEIGLMQIMPATAAMLGFGGSSTDLFKPETNIHFGVAYLARAWAASGGNVCRALMKYRAGVGQEAFSPLSIQYCQRAGTWLAAQNSPLADGVAQTTPLAPSTSDPHVIRIGSHAPFHPDMDALAAIADIPGMIVERSPAMWHAPRPGARAAAVMAAIQDGNTDPHVIHMPHPNP
jgi:soluble lytic murein transglycosylase-like protein